MSTDNATESKPRLLGRMLRRHWVGLLAVWLTSILFGLTLVWAMVKPQFKAYSILRAEPPSERIFGVNTSSETFDMFLQTQVQLITSPNVLTAAGTNPKVANLPRIRAAGDVIQELKKVVAVSVSTGTTLIEVSMTSPDSYESAVIVNAVVDSFLKTNEEWADSTTRTQIKGLEDYLRMLYGQTEELERRWEEIVAKGDVDANMLDEDRKNKQNPDGQRPSSITVEEFKTVRAQIFALELEIVQAEFWVKELRSMNKVAADSDVLNRIIERKFKKDPEVVDLAEKMKTAQAKIVEAVRISINEGDPTVVSARKKLEILRDQYNQLWDTKSAQLRELEKVSVDVFSDQQLREAEVKVRELLTKQGALKKLASELEVNTRKSATDAVKIQLIVDQRASLKNMEEAVQRSLEQLRYESRGDTKVRKINEATVSSKPVKDLRPLWLWLTPFATLMTSFCFFLVVEAAIGPPRLLTISDEPLDE